MYGECKKVSVRYDGELIGTRKNTRHYTHAVVDVETKSVMSYHKTEAAARGNAIPGRVVVPTEVEGWTNRKFGAIYGGRIYEIETIMNCRAIMLVFDKMESEPRVEVYEMIKKAIRWAQYLASDRCSTPSELVVVVPSTVAPYREPKAEECGIYKYAGSKIAA